MMRQNIDSNALPADWMAENERLLRENARLIAAIDYIGRECADIREGIRNHNPSMAVVDNSFFVIEECIAAIGKEPK